jgi:hypothetical protein
MLHYLLPVMRLVTISGFVGTAPWTALKVRDDVPIWDTAVAAGASYVVSHNARDFPPLVDGRHVYGGIEYLTAIEFIEQVLGADAARVYQQPIPPGALVRSRRVP